MTLKIGESSADRVVQCVAITERAPDVRYVTVREAVPGRWSPGERTHAVRRMRDLARKVAPANASYVKSTIRSEFHAGNRQHVTFVVSWRVS